jgi:hypothetical protein
MQAKDVSPRGSAPRRRRCGRSSTRRRTTFGSGSSSSRGGAGRDATDEGPRPRRHRGHRHRPVPRLRRNGDRRCAADRRAPRSAGDRSRAVRRRRRRARASTSTTRTLAQAASCPTRESPVSILFLSDGAQTRGLLQPLEGAKLAKDACFPVYTIALGTPKGVIERGPFGGFPGTGASQVIPVPPDPRRCARSRGRRAVSSPRRARPTRSRPHTEPRLAARPRDGQSEITWLFVAIAAGLLLLGTAVGAFVSPRLP